VQARVDELEKYTDRLSETGSQNSPSTVSHKRAKTSW
jgi:hypothetical protein